MARHLERLDNLIPMLMGQPMVCEQHPWRLWPDNDADCAGPGMQLGATDAIVRMKLAKQRDLFDAAILSGGDPVAAYGDAVALTWQAWRENG